MRHRKGPGYKSKVDLALETNPQASRKEVQKMVGDGIDIDGFLWARRKKGLPAPPPTRRWHRIEPNTPLERQIHNQLRDTIESASRIAGKFNLATSSLHYYSKKTGLRGTIFTEESKKKFGTSAVHGMGINPEKLRHIYEPLPAAKQQKMLQDHAGILNNKIDSFPIPDMRKEFGGFAISQLRIGIARYAPEMCSEKHFVMLVLENARRQFLDKRKRGITFEQISRLPLTNLFTAEQIDTLVTKHYKDIERMVATKTGREAKQYIKDLTQDAALRVADSLDRSNPDLHGPPVRFMQAIVTKVVWEFRHALRSQGAKLREYQDYQQLWNIYEQNKPANTNPRKQADGDF